MHFLILYEGAPSGFKKIHGASLHYSTVYACMLGVPLYVFHF